MGMAFKVFVVLQGVVKRFFNEKEVTSTLVMDALFSGCKQLEEASRQLESKKVQALASKALPKHYSDGDQLFLKRTYARS